jgi:hypothetical protein
MKKYILCLNIYKILAFGLLCALICFSSIANSQKISYDNNWSKPGLILKDQSKTSVNLTFSISEFSLKSKNINGEDMIQISLPGNFLPNDEGAPDLPGVSKYIAIPQGSKVSFEILASRVDTIKDVLIAPAFKIPKTTDDSPLQYKKNPNIYSRDAYYPENPVIISKPTSVRGVDAVILGITPYQYNPVTKELLVYRDIKVKVKFDGGNGQFGDNRLRSRFFDPILSDILLNYNSLPKVDYYKHNPASRTPDFEYVIITPNNPAYLAWADSIKLFRTMQGINTGVFTTDDIGGNTTSSIENFVDNAYNTWDIPPVAVLLIGDYGTTANTIVSPMWDNYCVSDNIYADVTNNDLPDIIFARMTAENETHLERMIGKVLDYERNPPLSSNFYNKPAFALGWQTTRWFQITTESLGGYFRNVQGKDPIRINEICNGTPGNIWSSATNTDMVVDYFGYSGLGYFPETPAELGGWTGGTNTDITNAINDGAFIILHRDHGLETGWSTPDYYNDDIDNISSTEPTFVFSLNCLTGKYNWSNECFTEKWHRHEFGCLGIIAASEASYSFVNDTYCWGMFDNMWPDFMPDEQSIPSPRGQFPAFGNAAGKYFLQQSSWPYNLTDKAVTYYLFHNHGDAFTELYSEVPQNLNVIHESFILAELNFLTVTSDIGSTISLSVDGQIIGIAEGTGSPVDVVITPQNSPDLVDIVITKTNHLRYHTQIPVVDASGTYIAKDSYSINDEAGNNNGQADYGETILLSIAMKNIGNEDGTGIQVEINSTDSYVTIIDGQADYGDILAGETVTITDGFEVEIAGEVPDNHNIIFEVIASDDSETSWKSILSLPVLAPDLQFLTFTVDDSGSGNGNGKFDIGETVDLIIDIANSGSANAHNVFGELICNDPHISINSGQLLFGDLNAGGNSNQSFSVTSSPSTPIGYNATFDINLGGDLGISGSGEFETSIGQILVLVVDMDRNHNSGPEIIQSINNYGIASLYTNSIPLNPNMYSIVFICLGTSNDNYILYQDEGEIFADFLDQGNNLYMEGAQTWYWDYPTPVHSYFNIEGIEWGSGDLGIINGQAGTFTESMSYNYEGDNNFINHIEAISPAFKIFQNQNPSYGTAVAYDAASYKTIGTVFEFGGLADGTNTRDELMEKYLNFFGFYGVPEAPTCPVGPTTLCQQSIISEYTTNSVANTTHYFWSVDPENAGNITGSDTIGTIEWDPSFSGLATINVCAINALGCSQLSENLTVDIFPTPTANISGSTAICINDSANLLFNLSGNAPWVVEINGGIESYEFSSSPSNKWVKPTVTTDYIITSVTDIYGCVNIGTGNALITVVETPTATISGNTDICVNDSAILTFNLSGNPPWIVEINGGIESYEFTSSPSSKWVKPIVTTDYIVSSVTDVYGCTNIGEGNALITVIELPDTADSPNGLIVINTETTPSSDYTVSEITNAISYTWNISPTISGELVPNETSCNITWNNSYLGSATLSVMGTNICGNGSEGILNIDVNPQSIEEFQNEYNVFLYPNPARDNITITFSSNNAMDYKIKIYNQFGMEVYATKGTHNGGKGSHQINIDSFVNGLYFLRMIISSEQVYQSKFEVVK